MLFEFVLTFEEVQAAREDSPSQEAAQRPSHSKPTGPSKLILDAKKYIVQNQRRTFHININRIPHRANDSWGT